MKTLGQIRKSKAAHKPEIEVLSCEDLLSEGECISYLDLSEITSSDLDVIEFDHVFVTSKDGTYQGLCLWFDVEFPNSITLNTSPDSKPTHWKQTLIILPEESVVEKGEPIACKLDIKRDQSNLRRYNIQFEMLDSEGVEHPTGCGCYMTKCILVKACLENYEK